MPWGVVAIGAAIAAALVVYARALNGGFIWDDPLVLQQLRAIRSLRDLFVLPPAIPRFYFRPLVFVSYLFDRALGGETPFWFHASVLFFHAVNIALVFLLGRRLFPDHRLIATSGAFLFAVFPTHVESVAWMAGRSDVLACTFMLLTLLLFLEKQRTASAWIGALMMLLAASSKELALAGLVLIPGVDLLATRRFWWRRYVPLVLATLVYFGLRHQALGTFVGGSATDTAPHVLVGAIARAVGFYTVQAMLPVRLCAYIPSVPAAPAYLLAGLLAAAAGVGFSILAWRRGGWPVAFLIAWFFVTLAPSLMVIVRRSASAPIADRYLYVPSVASCLLLGWGLVRMVEYFKLRARWTMAVLAVIIAGLGAETVRYTRVWADDLSFWSDVAVKVPDDALPHRELATALLNRNRLDEVERELQRALAGQSDSAGRAMTYNALGNLYRRLARYEEAERAFDAGIGVAPHPMLYHNLGMALMAHLEQEQRQGDQAAMKRDIVRARAAFEQALRLGSAPGAAQGFAQWEPSKTHALLGQVLFSLGDRAAAREHFEASLRLEPTGRIADVTRDYLRKIDQ